MSLLTYNIELSSKPDKTGRWSVMIRLHRKGHLPGRVLTRVKLLNAERHWSGLDQKRKSKRTGGATAWGKWIVRHPDKEALNNDILSEYERIRKQVEVWERAEPTVLFIPSLLAERFRSASNAHLYDQELQPILEEAKEQAYTTWRGKRTALNGFIAWAGKDLPTSNVTPQVVRQYQQYLLRKVIDTDTGQRMKASTINTYLDSLHSLHKALLISTGISPKQAEQQSPWNDRHRPDETRAKKSRLSETTIEQVSMIQVATRRRKMTPELSFNIWMLCHTLAGARFSDIMQLRYCHFRVEDKKPVHLNYEMMKTGFTINIPIYDQAAEVLAIWWQPDKHQPTDYLLPFLSNKEPYARLMNHEQYKSAPFDVRRKLGQTLAHWNNQMNLCLKDMQKEAGLTEKLKTHDARHSFADLARRIMQQDKTLSLYDIQLMLGHSEYKTTVGYMEELSGQDASGPMKAVFGRKKPKSDPQKADSDFI